MDKVYVIEESDDDEIPNQNNKSTGTHIARSTKQASNSDYAEQMFDSQLPDSPSSDTADFVLLSLTSHSDSDNELGGNELESSKDKKQIVISSDTDQECKKRPRAFKQTVLQVDKNTNIKVNFKMKNDNCKKRKEPQKKILKKTSSRQTSNDISGKYIQKKFHKHRLKKTSATMISTVSSSLEESSDEILQVISGSDSDVSMNVDESRTTLKSETLGNFVDNMQNKTEKITDRYSLNKLNRPSQPTASQTYLCIDQTVPAASDLHVHGLFRGKVEKEPTSRCLSPDIFSANEEDNVIEAAKADQVSESASETDDNVPIMDLVKNAPECLIELSDEETQEPQFDEEDVFKKFRLLRESLIQSLDRSLSLQENENKSDTDDESTQEPEFNLEETVKSNQLKPSVFHNDSDSSDDLPDYSAFLTQPFTFKSPLRPIPDQSEIECVQVPIDIPNARDSDRIPNFVKNNRGNNSDKECTSINSSDTNVSESSFKGHIESSPVFKASKYLPQGFKSSTPNQSTTSIMHSSPGTSIFEKMALSSQTNIQNNSDEEIDTCEVISVPILKLCSSDVQTVSGFEASKISRPISPPQEKNYPVRIEQEKNLQKSEIKAEPETVVYTQVDDDDVVEIFDSDDEDAFFSLSQVQVCVKPLPKSEDEDDVTAMAKLYPHEVTLEPPNKIPRISKLPDDKTEFYENIASDIELLLTDYKPKSSEHIEAGHLDNIVKHAPLQHENIEDFSDEDFYNHVDAMDYDFSEVNTFEKADTESKPLSGTKVSTTTKPNAINTELEDNMEHDSILEDVDNLSVSSSSDCYNDTTLGIDDDNRNFDAPLNKISFMDFTLKFKSDITKELLTDKKDTESKKPTITNVSPRSLSSLTKFCSDDNDDDDLFNLMSQADGIQSPDHISTYPTLALKPAQSKTITRTSKSKCNNILENCETKKPITDEKDLKSNIGKPLEFSSEDDEELFNLTSESDGIQTPVHISKHGSVRPKPYVNETITSRRTCETATVLENLMEEVTDNSFYGFISAGGTPNLNRIESRKEESMDDSDTELYFAVTQKAFTVADTASSEEDIFAYDQATQLVQPENNLETKIDKEVFNFHNKSKSLEAKSSLPKQIEPKRLESKKEVREKHKTVKEQSSHHEISFVSSKTQKAVTVTDTVSSEEDIFAYDQATQLVQPQNDLEKELFNSHKKSKSLETKTSLPKQIIQIEPKRLESKKEVREKHKIAKEQSSHHEISSVSSKKITNLTHSLSNASDVALRLQKKNLLSTKKQNFHKTITKIKDRNTWLNSKTKKKSPAKKFTKNNKKKEKEVDEPFSFTQIIGKAKKDMKYRRKQTDAIKLPTAKLAKTRYEEANLANTCSDVELPDVTEILSKQLPILTCDINNMKKKELAQQTNLAVSAQSNPGVDVSNKKSIESTSAHKLQNIEKIKLQSGQSCSAKKDNKKSLCVDKVNQNKKDSIKISNISDNQTTKQPTASKKKSISQTKGVSVVQKTSNAKKPRCLLDDLINKLGPVNKPAHLPFQMKTKAADKSGLAENPNKSKSTSIRSNIEIPDTVSLSSSCKPHVPPCIHELSSESSSKPASSSKPFVPSSTPTVPSSKPFAPPSKFTAPQSKPSKSSTTFSLNKPHIPLTDPRRDPRLKENTFTSSTASSSARHDPRLKENTFLSNIASSSARQETRLKENSFLSSTASSSARHDTRLKENTFTVSSTNSIHSRSNLMLKPGLPDLVSNDNSVKSCTRPKPNSVERIFSTDDYFRLLLNWNPIWLNEHAKSKKKFPPPVIGKNIVYPLLESYSNIQDYQEIFLNLMVLETWETVYRDWKEKQDSRRNVIYNIGLERIQPEGENIKFFWKHILPENQGGVYPREGDLVRIDLWGTFFDRSKQDPGQPPAGSWVPLIAFVEKVKVTHNQSVDSLLNKVSALGQDSLCKGKSVKCLEIITKLKYRKFIPFGKKLMKLEVLSNLDSNLRRMAALAYFPRSALQRDILKPGNERTFCHSNISSKQLMHEFDPSQNEAICTISQAVQQPYITPKICILQGPPGTGKSHTIVGLIHSIIKNRTSEGCICLATPSNAAADELMRRLIKDKLRNRQKNGNRGSLKFVRIGASDKVHPNVKDYCWDNIFSNNKDTELKEKQRRHIPGSVKQDLKRLEDRISNLKLEKQVLEKGKDKLKTDKCQLDLKKLVQQHRNLERQSFNSINQNREHLTPQEEYHLKRGILLRADIICGTLSSFGSLRILEHLRNDDKKQRRVHFDCLIIDEASQASELDCLIPLQYGMSKLVLVGDPEQLPATVISKKAGDLNFGQSLLERLYNYFQHNNPSAIIMLKTQYRMDRNIFSFPNRLIYNGQLSTHKSVDEVSQRFPLKPYIVFDMACGKEMVDGSTICNIVEAQCTVELCFLLSKRIDPAGIGVICPYQSQKSLVMEGLKHKNLGKVEVGTVDGFQGREKLVIILSCVRAQSAGGGIGFLADRRRLNVSLTRAKNALYILGHLSSLRKNGDWELLIEDAYERNAVVPVPHVSQFTVIAKTCFKKS